MPHDGDGDDGDDGDDDDDDDDDNWNGSKDLNCSNNNYQLKVV